MAAATAYSNRYDSSTGRPVGGRPLTQNTGPVPDFVALTFATTQLDDNADVTYALPVQSGRTIVHLDLCGFGDGDTGANLDMDIVLRTTSAAGVNTDTILFNAGAFFQTAQTAGAVYRVLCNAKVPNSADGTGHIVFLVNTGAAGGATQITGTLYAQVH
jgi:hypothetical protein